MTGAHLLVVASAFLRDPPRFSPPEHLFLRAFWQTMNREWTGIDRLRLDKFYMLMRMVLHESWMALKTRGWEERQTEQLLELLTTEILHPDSQAPSGVRSHFIEIFLEELARVGAHELTAEQNLRLIDPFCRIAARTQDSLVLHNITRGIFETIVEQAPLAIEELMNELDVQEEEEGEEQDVPSRKPPKGMSLSPWAPFVLGSVCGTGPDPGAEQSDDDDEDNAGSVLQFDYEAVASRLFEMASHQDTPPPNRKRLYKVIRKLQGLAEGLFPEDDIPEKAYRCPRGGRRVKMKRRLSQLQSRTGLAPTTGSRRSPTICLWEAPPALEWAPPVPQQVWVLSQLPQLPQLPQCRSPVLCFSSSGASKVPLGDWLSRFALVPVPKQSLAGATGTSGLTTTDPPTPSPRHPVMEQKTRAPDAGEQLKDTQVPGRGPFTWHRIACWDCPHRSGSVLPPPPKKQHCIHRGK
ncbi:ribosomal RNA processing protein 1 A isoform 4-like protein [Camelus ferus]|nr:ribosomal RNA processing protein 1 A isoform 4-like protein [Camelus ferus]